MKVPKTVFIATPADFTRFEECLKSLAEKYLSPTWEWTYKVNGKVQQDIERKDPENEGIQKIKSQGEEKHDVSQFRTPKREGESRGERDSRGERLGASGRLPPPPRSSDTYIAGCGGCFRKTRLANSQIEGRLRHVF